uniref:DUF1995 domain-containing protein n=1 Tax=Lupinus angustifolius TaxID=3871 RepID=L0P2H6_LUPAN|nr:hypothetical protein [Lupinus angustifolius]
MVCWDWDIMVIKLETLPLKNGGVTRIGGVTASLVPRNRKLTGCSVSDVSASTETNVPFPTDYTELLEQARVAVELAMKDNRQLMEIEFPTAGLASVPGSPYFTFLLFNFSFWIEFHCTLVPIYFQTDSYHSMISGDGEGGIEMTEIKTSVMINTPKILSLVTAPNSSGLLIYVQFFPEASEVDFARQSVFSGASFKLDYLTKPSFFQDFGFVEKVKMSDRVKAGDELFLVAYPYFNVNEMLVVEELYKEAVLNTERKLIIFNGELDRIRSGCILCQIIQPSYL